MFKSIKRNLFPALIAFSALSVSASAAFYSVTGLSKLFAGASMEVIIMAASLEIAKLVIASLLYQYWDSINKWLRGYLTMAAVVLVLITSMGIYGFLSAAYQETYSKLMVSQNEISFLENKAQFYEDDVTRYDEELERISNNISTLSNARSQQIQVRDTTVAGGVRTTISTSELRLAQSRIETEENNRKEVQAKREVAADSLQSIQLQILELQNTSDVAGELGPLQYLSGLTGAPMDKIINWLLLVIIFVFDPLAISLVVAANFAFDRAKPKTKDEEVPANSAFEGVDEYTERDVETLMDAVYGKEQEPNDVLKKAAQDYAEDFLDHPAEPKKPADISMDHEDAKKWEQLADELAKGTAELDDEDLLLEEEFGHLVAEQPPVEEDEWDEDHALDQVLNDMVEGLTEEELEELNTDRVGTFPNENNPFSVAAQVQDIVEKVETPHLPINEITTTTTSTTTTTTQAPTTTTTTEAPTTTIPPEDVPKLDLPDEARGFVPPVIDEDELFDAALRARAEQDKQEFLRKNGKQN